MSRHLHLSLLASAACFAFSLIQGASIDAADFEIRWADVPIDIDGRGDEPQWEHAELIDRFTLPWLGDQARSAKTATRARLMWDRQYLYFLAEMDDADVFADVVEHDGTTWHNDVFELFFKPADDKPGYYEFQVNAAGTLFDMFAPSRSEKMVERFARAREFHIDSTVDVRGTLNQRDDADQGWTVEGRVPWSDFLPTGGRPDVGEHWSFALCRYDYTVDTDQPELSTCAPLTRPSFHRHEDYARASFVGPTSEFASRPYGIAARTAMTTSRVVGSPTPPPPYRVVRVLPELNVKYPVFAASEPGSRRLIFIDEVWNYGTTRILRTTDDPATTELEVLLDRSDRNEVAYAIGFHPQFTDNGYMYVGSNLQDGDEPKKCRITRYTISREPPFGLDPDSELVILEWDSDGHNGAAMTFGNDGMMYVTTGDGTTSSDRAVVGQAMDNLLSKVLRIDVDHAEENSSYSIPKDNPFYGQSDMRWETWAYGLRNPWRITTDQQTGAIWIAQNGQDLWEQVYVLKRGANYGWSAYEGSHPFVPARFGGPSPLTLPTFEHPHSEARSLTGGVVYYGKQFPDLVGAYLYGDYSTGKIWAGRLDESGHVSWHQEIADSNLRITSISTDADGELLITDHQPLGKAGFYTLEPNPSPKERSDFPRTLSASGLFASVAGHEMAPGVIPYDVNSPLWSDGAIKARFMAIPESSGEKGRPPEIGFDPRISWEFPDGTVLVKSFALDLTEGDPASRRWIETRFLTRQDGEWAGYSYQWNDDQTDAVLVDASGSDRDFTISTADGIRKQKWHYPSRTECMVCHTRAANFVLGLSTAQMNREFDYEGARDNQLRTLESLGLFSVKWHDRIIEGVKRQISSDGIQSEEVDEIVAGMVASDDQRQAVPSHLLDRAPQDYDRLANPYLESESVAARARSYLHVNCAHCHVEGGGGNAKFDLTYTRDARGTRAIGVTPLHDKFDLTDARLIAPGHPERSVVLHRMAMRGPGQMPQLATDIVDDKAVEVVREWIANLPPSSD